VRLREAAVARWPELLLLTLGILLRVAALRSSPSLQSYDFESHWKYIEWFRTHWALPDCNWSRETFHPPLFYWLAGLTVRAGGGERAVAALSVLAGSARLVIIALGLRLALPGKRVAQLGALALACVLPASVQLDGMVGGEPLSGCLAALAMLLVLLIFRADGRRRWRLAGLLGICLALALMTKLSALVLLAAIAFGAAAEWLAGPPSLAARGRRAAPWLLAAAIVLAITGWYFARNQRLYGRPFVTSFECKERFQVTQNPIAQDSYFKRRPRDYYFGFTTDIYSFPYYPSGIKPRSHFFAVLTASAFSDYYDFYFGPRPLAGQPSVAVFRTPIRLTTFWLSRLSVAAGTLVLLATTAAWMLALAHALRRRSLDQLTLLLIPALALLAQLHFATQYPFDHLGVVKAAYLQFAAPPLAAAFGVAIWWCWRRGAATRVGAGLLALAVALTGAYSVYCRLS
jgi:4-amino-4-deoxy-L-arabinose transferase-like glycosyltransferase